MKLLTKALIKKFPKLYSNENTPTEKIKIIAKFFAVWSNWTWFATEFDQKDTFFGMVHGHENELGYFSLNELESLRGPGGLRIERDLYYGDKHTLSEVM